MDMERSIAAVSTVADRVLDALVAGLEIEFGKVAGEALAHRFVEAEEVDFHWDARVEERWLGSFERIDEEELELDRVLILGRLDGLWFIAIMIVDGDGQAHGMLSRRTFSTRKGARKAYGDIH